MKIDASMLWLFFSLSLKIILFYARDFCFHTAPLINMSESERSLCLIDRRCDELGFMVLFEDMS